MQWVHVPPGNTFFLLLFGDKWLYHLVDCLKEWKSPNTLWELMFDHLRIMYFHCMLEMKVRNNVIFLSTVWLHS